MVPYSTLLLKVDLGDKSLAVKLANLSSGQRQFVQIDGAGDPLLPETLRGLVEGVTGGGHHFEEGVHLNARAAQWLERIDHICKVR